ncbi:MAG TPA: HAMP domain-containing sensor histidine kinase [Chitinophagaceae bacterium]
MEILHRLQHLQQRTIRSFDFSTGQLYNAWQNKLSYLQRIRSIGAHISLDDYEQRKLGIFNQLNFFQLITGILIPVVGFFSSSTLPGSAWVVAALPAIISIVVLWLNSQYRHELALLIYFVFYPVFTCIIYMNGMNLGLELFFVLYGILAVFFFQDIGYLLFAAALSMMSYFILSVALKNYQYQLKSLNIMVYMLYQGAGMLYIFYGLYLIKRENYVYQASINMQKAELTGQAKLLQQQANELAELNVLNNKLFSIISHDLKTPMYALRNFFQNAKDMKLSAREVKSMLPDVINDLNYTTGLMDNLLHWAKSQMQSNEVRPRELDVNALIYEVIQVLRLQAEAKEIIIQRKTDLPVYAYADRDMINLVIRNLLSNAIKFTKPGGIIVIGTQQYDCFAEVYIRDSGVGISTEQMQKINSNNFYSTNGTSSESGTGLGLTLCKEFLLRNGGRMMIESEPGHGSTFSFTLPQQER